MPPTLSPQDFVAKWREVELKESAALARATMCIDESETKDNRKCPISMN